jgi:NADH-quinone oxidoreductase subunit I
MAEYCRQSLVYEKEHLLIAGTGKDPNYNFFKVAGVKGGGQAAKDPRSLLP